MKVDPELEHTLKSAPQADVAVIVHVHGDPTQYTGSIASLGLATTRTFQLTNTLAVHGAASCVLELADRPWVIKIESDRQIKTQR